MNLGGPLVMWVESKMAVLETLKGEYSLSVKFTIQCKKTCLKRFL